PGNVRFRRADAQRQREVQLHVPLREVEAPERRERVEIAGGDPIPDAAAESAPDELRAADAREPVTRAEIELRPREVDEVSQVDVVDLQRLLRLLQVG